ncbi:MAG: hypothetical protein M3Q65_17245 [Chloroflexota bacterium]|nr:hypothetical protein [Chloroflexota bacterium]
MVDARQPEVIAGTTCPVCLLEGAFQEPGGYDICHRCGWEDDESQRRHPDMAGGANHMSLGEARRAWREGREVD